MSLCLAAAVVGCGKIQPDDPDPDPRPEIIKIEETKLVYPAPEHKGFTRVAYFPSYRNVGESLVPDYIYESVDVCCYAFASINSTYTVDLQEPTVLKALVARAHTMGKKVLISLNGTNDTYVKMSTNPDLRKKFIDSVMKIVDDYGLDGVDNDWEYPKSGNNSDKGNYELMKEFSNILHAPERKQLLTMAITPGKYAGAVREGILTEVFDTVDWFNVMVYDDFSTTVSGINHSSYELLTDAYSYWINDRKLPKSKCVMGLPCYGRASGITQSGTTKSYSAILSAGGDPDADSAMVSANSTSYSGTYEIFYNGRKMIRKKVDFCLEHNLGGYMFWEQGQDCYTDKELSLLYTASKEIETYNK